MNAIEIGGLPIPDAGPVFLAALAVHVLAGATAIGALVLAATAPKRPGRHPRAGTVYLAAIGTVFATASVLAAIRWREDRHLFAIATVAAGLAATGWWARRRRPRRWLLVHGAAMAGSAVALFTGFYVDNGPNLPLWRSLPHAAYWLVPLAVGAPLTWRALRRNGAFGPPRPGRAADVPAQPAAAHPPDRGAARGGSGAQGR
jgi:hypothetical protein